MHLQQPRETATSAKAILNICYIIILRPALVPFLAQANQPGNDLFSRLPRSTPVPPLADPDGLGGKEVQDLHHLELGILELSEGLADGGLGCLLVHLRI